MLEQETEEHNASAYINEIAPRYGEPSRNPIELNCNVTTLVRESVTKLTLGETLHADVVIVQGSGDPAPALKDQILLLDILHVSTGKPLLLKSLWIALAVSE